MKVADAVRGPVRVVRADTPLPIVAAELAAQAGGAVPVVDTAGNLVGLLTAAGLAHAGEGRVEEINPEDVVAAVMTHRPATVGMDDPGGRRGGRGARPGRRCGRRRRRRPGGRRANPPRAGGPRGRRRFRHQAGTEYGLRAVAEAGRRPGSISISLPAFADSTEPVSTTRVDNRCRMPWLHPLALGWVVEAEARRNGEPAVPVRAEHDDRGGGARRLHHPLGHRTESVLLRCAGEQLGPDLGRRLQPPLPQPGLLVQVRVLGRDPRRSDQRLDHHESAEVNSCPPAFSVRWRVPWTESARARQRR